MRKNTRSTQVFVHANMTSLHERRFLRGVFAYAKEQTPVWSVRWGSGMGESLLKDMQTKDGIFSFGLQEAGKRKLEVLGPPIVNFSSINLPWPGVASVAPDNEAIGRMAAEYFLDRLHRNFLFVGVHTHSYSRERLAGFRKRLAGLDVCVVDEYKDGRDADAWIGSKLRKLPRPLAVFAANDLFARRVCRIAVAEGFSVPEDIAVLGVDREELVSMSSPVPLSSVDVDSENMGRRAAEVLHGIFEGIIAPDHKELFPPCGVVTDLSTDSLATEDEGLAKALRFIRDHAFEKILVEDVARHAGVGRRSLERKFSDLVGKSIDQSIRQTRLERARTLLRDSKLTLDDIAERCGFSSTDYFSKVFKAHTGQTPSVF
ncbi:MAG: substrate-binding domain-containing protein, partial [Verrucomicrobia bacterium]|nr:substrate-binding domain-containing protein [Verrucomicrobiota bacterium]